MAETVRKIEDLSALDDSIHWFCPRSFEDQDGTYYDEDALDILLTETETEQDKTTRLAKVQEADERKNEALNACKILAFDGSDAEPYKIRLKDGLKQQLTRCDICVREFHRSRSQLQVSLEAEHETEEVRLFLKKFDAMNMARIGAGLNVMTESLHDLPPQSRTMTAAGDVAMYALFEALNCGPFLTNEEKLRQFFDQPFRLVQTKTKLRLPSYAPGVTAFLFSHNEQRATWAHTNFGKMKRPLTGTEFEYSVKPFLEAAATRVNIISLEIGFLAHFWKAMRLIVSKLIKETVTNNLRTMEINIYQLAMEHWQVDAPHFMDMVACFQNLLELSPTDFWDAMGGINGQHVAENILRSPVLQRLLKTKDELQPLRLEEKLAWVLPFIRSIKPANLVPPARALFDQLLHKFQDEPYSAYAQAVSWKIGLQALLETISRIRKLGGGPVVVHMIEVISKEHIGDILQELEGIEKKNAEMSIDETEQLCLDIVEASLSLDVQSLSFSRKVLLTSKSLDHEIAVSGLQIWKMAMRLIKPGYPALATSVLGGTTGLLSLEKFTERQMKHAKEVHEKEKEKDKSGRTPTQPSGDVIFKQFQAWNSALDRIMRHVHTDLLERLESFTPDQLVGVYLEPKAAEALVMLLFNGDIHIHRATLNIFKTLSGEDSRRGTIMHLVKAFFGSTLTAVSHAQSTIAKAGIFTPSSTFLKLSTDILSCLCDSQDGFLRSETLTEEGDVKALETLWAQTWDVLQMIFSRTEPWSNLGYDKVLMQDFCRETMDFADFAFEQYSIVATTLRTAKREAGSSKEVGKKLLRFPTEAFTNIIKWLRLRDDYLVSKAVSLTCKMLLRLQEVGIEINRPAAQYVENVVMSTDKNTMVKTKLSMNQKAELQRALEKHLGEELEGIVDVQSVKKQQGTLAGWTTNTPGSSGRSTPVAGMKTASGKGVIDVDSWAAKSEAEKARRQTEHEEAYSDLIAGASKGKNAWQQHLADQKVERKKMPATQKAAQKHQEDSRSFLLKRKQEMEAQKKARAEALARQTVGAGSGVMGLGDVGKDHSLKGQNVMVSSDEEESEEDEEDVDDDLFGLKDKIKKRIERPNVDPNGALGLRPEVRKGPTRIQRAVRSHKDMRARLAPDLQHLHKVILKWDFFHTGDYPPGANEHIFQEVRNSYLDPITYQQTFEPLLTLEAWQNLIRAREENMNKAYEVKVLNRSSVDNLIEISSMISQAENRDLSLQEGDVVLLSKARRPTEDGSAPHGLARIGKLKRQKGQIEVVYQTMPGTSLAPSLTSQVVVYGVKVQSITPLEREYGALQALQYYDLCTQICKAAPSKRINYSEAQIKKAQDTWNVNRAQSEAINAALENEGFSLIQGPPGSGKTKTIIAIVGGLLTQTLASGSSGATKITVPRSGMGGQGFGAGGDAAPSKKLLVCAPSNAAVDELVMRLKEGVKTRASRALLPINVVRIGRSDAINTQVLDVTMDELVSKRIGGNGPNDATRARTADLFKEHEKVSAALRELYTKRDSGEAKGKELTVLDNEIVSVRKRKNELGIRIDTVKDQERNAGREAELNRKRAQQAVLDEAHVICATLSGSGHDMFQSLNIEFETVIIDEAAQCVEMSSLIPLKYGCVKCVMVGDPKQLPPTVFSKEAARFQYEQSLFVRMQNNFPNEVHLLDTQYRMHPDISLFPSRTFYDGLLKDGDGMAGLRIQPWHTSALLAPYRFFDVQGQHQASTKGHSLINIAEVEVAMAIFERLTTDFKGYEYSGQVGVITPYKSQLRMLKDRFAQRFGQAIFDTVEFNTTDAFQGRESEIIIFSCVRASPGGGIGFLQDIRRMNVGLTRAKSSLWVLGNSDSLMRGQFWRKLVEDAKARDAWTGGDIIGMLRKPSSHFPADKGKTASMWDVDSHLPQMEKSSRAAPAITPNGTRRPPAAPSAPGVRRTSDGKSSAADGDMRKTGFPGQAKASEVEKMDGIRYRFEDRVSRKPRAANSESADNDLEMEDVDATDADSAVSGTMATRSRDETPLSNASEEKGSGSTRAIGSSGAAPVKSRPPTGALSAVPPVVRKRPAASSPFIPKKPKPGR